MSEQTTYFMNQGILGVIVVVLATLIAIVGLWAKSVIERLVTNYVKNDEVRAVAAERTAKTQEHLGGLVENIQSTLGTHGKAHRATLTALQDLVPPASSTHREVSEVKGMLS